MRVNAHLDVEVVAVEQDEQVSVMLELVAPAAAQAAERPAATVQIVLDRSGSMAGERLDAAKQALVRLVDRLDPADRLGVVAFDDDVRVVVPAGRLTGKAAARAAIEALEPGGLTNLSGGLLRGLQEARRVAGKSGATLLLLSDGHANAGETDPARLGAVAAQARKRGITTSTVGIGLGYDEALLSALARGGQGDHVFAEQSEHAAAAVAGEVDGLLSKTVQAASLLIRPDAPVERVTLWNDLASQPVDGGVMVEVGDLWAAEARTLLLTFAVPARPALGLARIAELELRSVAVPALEEQTITIPVHVNVVPGDQAAGRIPDPKVCTELIYQQVQDAKRRASDALRDGDRGAATQACGAAAALIPAAAPVELADERAILAELAHRTDAGEVAWAAKFARSEHARKSGRRGRGGLGV
jgi:Ca-activated chloride channel family protein